jgi:serine/threonine protein kinase
MRIGDYRPCFEIGSGGMANVYIAQELGISGLQRTVALKVMHEHLAHQEEFKKRFLDEARVLTQITHPYVCRVVGFGEESGRPFMAMEYLVGEPISRVLRAMKRRADGVSAKDRARFFARVIADVAEGLHAAHETRDSQGKLMGIVHRDVSPQNLFLLYDGTVRVLDFGIARFADRNVNTVTSRLLGKLPYMAPEQVLSEPYDRRADVWALGVVLWELATLGRLFKRETEMRTMRAVCSEPIPRVSEYVDGIPPGLDEILARALERNMVLRYENARELSRALELWLARTGDPVTHGDLTDFLDGFFPGSELERRRWAEESTPTSGIRLARPEEEDDEEDAATTPHARESVTAAPLRRVPSALLTVPPPLRPLPSFRSPAIAPVIPEDRSDAITGSLDAVVESSRKRQRGSAERFVAPVVLTMFLAVLAIVAYPKEPVGVAHTAFARVSAVTLPLPIALNSADGDMTAVASKAPTITPQPVDVASRPLEPSSPAQVARKPSRTVAAPSVPQEIPPSIETSTESTGDLLIVSKTPGVRLFHGSRFLGTTPVKARFPAGAVTLRLQVSEGAGSVTTTATVLAGRLSMITVDVHP